MNFIKMENFCSVRDTVNRRRQLATLRGVTPDNEVKCSHVVIHTCNCRIQTEDHEFEANWGHAASLQRKRKRGKGGKGERKEKEKQKEEKRNKMRRRRERTAV